MLDLSDATKPEPLEEEFSPSTIGEGGEHVSGMHMVNPDTHWSFPEVGMADDEEHADDLKKEALGITDIPASVHGGEVLDFQGIPQNPGLSRENGEDEEMDYFGAESEIIEDVPSKNKRYETYEYLDDLVVQEELNFFDFLEDKLKTTRSYLDYINDLHVALLKIGNSEDSLVLQHILKRAGKLNEETLEQKAKRYCLAKNVLVAKAVDSGIRVDYEPRTWSDGVSFIFKGAHEKGGGWYYDHGTVMKSVPVQDIVSGAEDPSWTGLESYQLEASAGLNELGDDLIGGIVFLHSFAKDNDALLDWVDSSVAIYREALSDISASLRSVTIKPLDGKRIYSSASVRIDFEGNMIEYLKELKADLEKLDKVREAKAIEIIEKTAQYRGPGDSDFSWHDVPEKKKVEQVTSQTGTSQQPTPETNISYSSIDDMVSDGVITQKAIEELRQQSRDEGIPFSQMADELPGYISEEYNVDIGIAKQISDFLVSESNTPSAATARTTSFRFPRSQTVQAVQKAIGAGADGLWGSKTDEAWNQRMKDVGVGTSYMVGGQNFPNTPEEAIQLLTSTTTDPPPAAVQPAAKAVPAEQPEEVAEEAKTPQESDSNTRSAIQKIELSLTDRRKGKPEMMSFIAGTESRRGVALIQWPQETDPAKKYDTIIQLEDGTWELGAATRREMRALRRPYLKDVKKEVRRERKDLSRKELRNLRREERKRRREASFDSREDIKKEARSRMSERAKKLLK